MKCLARQARSAPEGVSEGYSRPPRCAEAKMELIGSATSSRQNRQWRVSFAERMRGASVHREYVAQSAITGFVHAQRPRPVGEILRQQLRIRMRVERMGLEILTLCTSNDFSVILPPVIPAIADSALLRRSRTSSDFKRSRTKGTGFPRSRE
ncbi:hypothetical protein [Lysobacter gummosus]|uniref:hypothetical protein n=1 Tax=Lysobacter gummosus TaxID=262324 RepID=UPI0036421ACB